MRLPGCNSRRWKRGMNHQLGRFAIVAGLAVGACWSQADTTELKGSFKKGAYILAPGDQITVRVPDAAEINEKTYRISQGGHVNLALIGPVNASGLTVEQIEAELTGRLKKFFKEPQVSVTVTDFRSQPVSVIGAVN